MLPARPHPLGATPGGDARIAPGGFADTVFTCRLDPAIATIAVTTPPAGMTAVGGYRFLQREMNAVIVNADPAASIAELPHASFVQRLASSGRDRAASEAALPPRGDNALLAGAFRPRGTLNAAQSRAGGSGNRLLLHVNGQPVAAE